MDSKTASIMDLGYGIKCALCATHSVGPGPLACAHFNQTGQSSLHCDGRGADIRPIGMTRVELMAEDIDSRFREICNATI